jgi:glycosyltransferase involved in cell wall biosynthesis
MRILIDFTPIPIDRTGVGVYAENLIREIALILHPDDLLFVLVQDDEKVIPQIVQNVANTRIVAIASRLFRNRAALMIYEQCILPWILLTKRIDVIHSLHYMHPIVSPAARVVTVHDLTHSLWPQLHTRSRRLLMPLFAKRAVKFAEAVIFDSASTLSDAERLWSTGNNLRRVVPLGVAPEAFSALPEKAIQETRQRLNIQQPYILFMGTIEPRKNLIRLINAFEEIGNIHQDYLLVIAGKLGWDYESVLKAIASSPLRERICHLGYVPEADKRALIGGCKVLAYPSLYEGFGLPVLEGMAAGVPVVTSNVSSIPEVAGNAAVMVDPNSVDQIASAINQVLTDPSLAARLGAAGYQRAREFSWGRTAHNTYELYHAVFRATKQV